MVLIFVKNIHIKKSPEQRSMPFARWEDSQQDVLMRKYSKGCNTVGLGKELCRNLSYNEYNKIRSSYISNKAMTIQGVMA